MLAVGGGAAADGTNCGPPDSLTGSCFAAADGDQLAGPGDLTDWQSVTDLGPVVDTSRGIDSKFKDGSKELDPGGWDFVVGNNPPKTDLLDGWSKLQDGFLYVAFTRVKQEGDTYISFELNQLGAGPRESNGIPVPHRSTGDVLITYDISTTNRISVGMCTWTGDENTGNWLRMDSTPIGGAIKTCTPLDPNTSPAAIGAVNFGKPITADDNYLQDHSAGIGAGQFGEAAVDLNALPGGAGRFTPNACAPNGWFWMHSRSSDSVTSDPKDLLAGAPISSPTCLSSASGTKFEDTNGNGAHDDGEGPLSGFMFYVDYNDNGQPDPGEPAGTSGDDGTWQITGVDPGTWNVREATDPNFTCTMPNPCVRQVTFTAGESSDAGDWGNAPPAQVVAPTEQGATPGEQIVLDTRIGPGSARLVGPTGCTARAFHARVRGTKITRVVFILDGRVVVKLRKPNLHKTFALRVDPRRLRAGVHRLVAQVTFERGSGTKPKTFRLSFQRCPRALRAPRFTG